MMSKVIKYTVGYGGLNTVLCKRDFYDDKKIIFKRGKEYFISTIHEDGMIIYFDVIVGHNEILWADCRKFYWETIKKYERKFNPVIKSYFIVGLKERRRAKLRKLKRK